MANAPLFGTEWLRLVEVICPTGQAKYFFREDWTGRIALIVKENFPFARTAKSESITAIAAITRRRREIRVLSRGSESAQARGNPDRAPPSRVTKARRTLCLPPRSTWSVPRSRTESCPAHR